VSRNRRRTVAESNSLVDHSVVDVSMARPTDRRQLGTVASNNSRTAGSMSRRGRVARGAKRTAASNRVSHQRSIAGVIVEFMADETWLTVIAGVSSCLMGIGLLARPPVARTLAAHLSGVWSPSELSDVTDG